MARIHAPIAERAGQQLGLLRRDDLDELGVSTHQVRWCTSTDLLIAEGRRVFRHAGFARSFEQRLLAAAWVAGPGAAVSHLAAAELWRFDGVRNGAVEVSVPRPRNPRAVPAVVHRVRDLLPVDLAQHGLIPVTSPSRTLSTPPLTWRPGSSRSRSTAPAAAARSTSRTCAGGWASCAARDGRVSPRSTRSCAGRSRAPARSPGSSRPSSASMTPRDRFWASFPRPSHPNRVQKAPDSAQTRRHPRPRSDRPALLDPVPAPQ